MSRYDFVRGHYVVDVEVREPCTTRHRRVALRADAYNAGAPPTVTVTETWLNGPQPTRITVLTRAGSLDGLPFYEEWEPVPAEVAPRAGDVWITADGVRQPWSPGSRGAPPGRWSPTGDMLIRPLRTRGDAAIYATPAMVAARKAPDAAVCCDPECTLSGGYAHVGDCIPCGCGKRHAAVECPMEKA